MPTKLGNPYSPLWRGKYPHMLKEDFPVWERFLNANQQRFDRIYYDVRVGGVWSEDPTVTQTDKEMFFDVTAKRIDALAETTKDLWLIEVAATPGLRATGQLLTYLALWHESPPINKPIQPVLVCDFVDDDVKRAMKIYGVLVIN